MVVNRKALARRVPKPPRKSLVPQARKAAMLNCADPNGDETSTLDEVNTGQPMGSGGRRGSASLSGALEFDFDQLAVGVGDLEHVAALEMHEAGDEDVGDLSDASVVGVDVIIEKFAAVGDTFFEFGDAILQLEEILVGLELGIILRNGEEAVKSTGHEQVGLRLFWNGGSAHGSGASFRDGDKCLLLVLHVSLNRFDEIGDLVVPLLQEDINIGPGAIVLVAQAHQSVVEDDGVDKYSDKEEKKDELGEKVGVHGEDSDGHMLTEAGVRSNGQVGKADSLSLRFFGKEKEPRAGHGVLQGKLFVAVQPGMIIETGRWLWLLRLQVARPFNHLQVEAFRGKFGDLWPTAGARLDVEDLRLEHTADRSFIHGKVVAADPVPAMMSMEVVDTNHDFHLRLSPKAGAIGRSKADSRVEIAHFELAVFAEQIDARLEVRIFAEVVVRDQLEAGALGAGHFVFGLKFRPAAAGIDTVLLALVGAQRALLREPSGGQNERKDCDCDSLTKLYRWAEKAHQHDLQ